MVKSWSTGAKNIFQAIVAKQNDSNSRFLRVTLLDEGTKIEVPTTATATINALRADNTAKAFAGTVNSDGTVTVPLTNWMLELDNTVKCSISILSPDSQRLTSTSFSIDVETAEFEGEGIQYRMGKITQAQMMQAVSRGIITAEEYTVIVGGDTDVH